LLRLRERRLGAPRNHFTTAAIPAITTELASPWDLHPGDALNKAGTHVMLFLRFTPDRKAEVMESSTGGCNGRVCRNVYPLASLLARGFKPVRFNALQDQTVVAAAASNDDKSAGKGVMHAPHLPRKPGKVRRGRSRAGAITESTRRRQGDEHLVQRRRFLLPIRVIAALTLGPLAVFGLIFAPCSAAEAAIRPPQGGEVRAVVIGIDAYQFVPPLRGAVADARDIEQTLRSQGVRDVTALYDAAADRTTVMRTLDQLLQRSQSGDLVVLSIAGHGVQEPEHTKGSQPDGFDNVFVLAGFNPKTGAGTQQRIIGTEFNHMIKQFEAKGANVLFVADACYGGGLAREIDPRADEMSYRQAPRYALTVDNLQPISTASDAFLSDIDFERTSFLAAVDRNTKAPEVRIPGVPGFRGALSYAVARAFEGAADQIATAGCRIRNCSPMCAR